ncbi:MAG TPA: glycosyltransferase [Syntrophales bacterium]|nr:glycosyltransferase [Syntrophales bacterium]
MKPAVINIMPHGPAYHFSPDEKPDVFWEKPDGSLVGFWTREWPDLLGEEILKITDRYTWEVWQPDYRADRIYSKTLNSGVTHYLFPAADKICRPGIRRQNGIYSSAIIEKLDSLKNDQIILQLHGFRVPFYNEILKHIGPQKKFPVMLTGHGMPVVPVSELCGLHRPLTYLCLLVEQMRLERVLQYVDVISVQAESAVAEIRKVFKGRIEKLTMGCNFDFWYPVPSIDTKASIRKELRISNDKTVFLTTGNFVPLKQLDKLIDIFVKIKNRDDFFLMVVGHGDEGNTRLLSLLIQPLVEEEKALLHPYVTDQALRDLYWSSDLYAIVSTAEGSSVAAMKAFACGLPLLSTPAGETAEMLKRYGVGKLIPVSDYSAWEKAVVEILEKGLPPPLDRQIAKQAYHWPEVVGKFLRVYDELVSYYPTESGDKRIA